jgi:hypothetical protein
MSEWILTARTAMTIAEEKTSAKRESVKLERVNLTRTLRQMVFSLLSFLF